MKLNKQVLSIKRSSGEIPTWVLNSSGQLVDKGEEKKKKEMTPSKVLVLKDVIPKKDLEDNEKYDKYYEDFMAECKIYGKVLSLKIPKPSRSRTVTGLGNIYVEFATIDGCTFARDKLGGKSRNNKFVDVVFHSEDAYRRNQFE